MEILIIVTLFLVAMILEIVTDVLNITNKPYAHITQLMTFGFYLMLGIVITLYYVVWNPKVGYPLFPWRSLFLIPGFALMRAALFNTIINKMMEWQKGYKGKSNFFDRALLKLMEWIIGKFDEMEKPKTKRFFENAFILIQISLPPILIFMSVICFTFMVIEPINGWGI